MKNIKLKPLTKEQIIISTDRLTRFKFTETKYMRVFKDILVNNLIEPKYKKTEIDNLDYAEITRLAEFIINFSLKELGVNIENSNRINKELKDYENYLFKLDDNTNKFLENNINYDGITVLAENSDVKNLQWFNSLKTDSDRILMRENHSLKYPLSCVLICEGITEETLLPEFARICGYDFDKNGVFVISAGGKNQVVKTFYQLAEFLKIPIFVLLDSDADENYREILPKLRANDKIHIIKHGEFEDILPVHLLEKTLTYATRNISLTENEKIEDGKTVEYLTEFFKHRGLHEFKKAEFAAMVKFNISDKTDVSDEIREIILELSKTSSNALENS